MKSYTWDGKDGNSWKYTISGYDTRAYYSYLPDFFIKHNLKISDSTLPYVNVTDKGLFNKHFVGPAVLWSPFFIAAVEYLKLKNIHTDGYSGAPVKSIGIAALLWLFIGLCCLWKILEFFNISDIVISLTILLITFGTNLFFYSFKEYTMTHVYSFSLLAVFIYTGIKYSNTQRKIYLILMSLSFGLNLLLRPTSICLFPCLLPLICGDYKKIIPTFFRPATLLISISVIVPIVFLQFGAWYMQTGHWLVNAYSGENFYFLHPKIFKVFFSFQNGWFIYTPLALLSLFGFIKLYKINRTAFYSCSLAIAIWVYLVASWYAWSFADGFEHRAFIDIYPVLAIGTAHLFPSSKNGIYSLFSPLKKFFITSVLLLLSGLFVALNLIQTYQFSRHILTTYWMDWNSYQYVFLKTSDKYIDCLGGQKDLPLYTNKSPHIVFSSALNFAQPKSEWSIKHPENLNSRAVIHFEGDEFGACVNIPSDSISMKGGMYYAKIILTRFEPKGNCSSGVLLVYDAINNNHGYYTAFKINDYPSGKDSNTRTYYYGLEIPWVVHKNSNVSFYIWNKDRQDFYLTGLSVEVDRYFP